MANLLSQKPFWSEHVTSNLINENTKNYTKKPKYLGKNNMYPKKPKKSSMYNIYQKLKTTAHTNKRRSRGGRIRRTRKNKRITK